MSAFDLFPAEAADKVERGRAVDLNAGPGFFEGAMSAPLKGAAKGLLVEPARVLNLGLSFAPELVDQALGSHTRDWWFENMMLERASRRLTPNPREVGVAGQMLHALFDVGSQAVVGGPAMVGMLKAAGKSIEGVEEGLDVGTAMRKGAIEGTAAGVGVALPISMKPIASKIPELVQQLGYGVAANVPLGIAQRGLTHQVLDAAGYKDMAEQYKALDEVGLMTDFVLGVAFGGLGHAIEAKGARLPIISPSEVDAALTRRNAYHLEVDTAPGLAQNAQTRDAHVDSMLKATEDLIAGRPVDISETLRAADFEPNPTVDKGRAATVAQSQKVMEPIIRAADEVRKVDEAAAAKAGEQLELPIPPERAAQIETALKAEGIESTPQNVLQVHIIAQARAVDAAAVDAIPLTLSDSAYLAKVQEVIDGNQKTANAGAAGQEPAGARAGAEGDNARQGQEGASPAGREAGKTQQGGEGARRIEEAEIRGAEELVAKNPDMLVTLEDGRTLPAHQVLAQADEVIAQAQNDAKAFEAAALCATRRGG